MKILLAGGGTGGHFYPIIAVAEALYDLTEEEHLLAPQIILMADKKYDSDLLDKLGIKFRQISSGKIRRYFSLLNFTDPLKTVVGILKAIFVVYSEMPDVIFGKGGYASFPPLLAARIFGIPIIIHESDSMPGKTNKWAGKFAKRIAISFPEAAKYFLKEKIALTGTPVRKSLFGSSPEEAVEIFKLEKDLSTLLVLGGSQGARVINDAILDIAPELLKSCQVIHQCGVKNEKETLGRFKVMMENSSFKSRYHLHSYLNNLELRAVSKIAGLIISRAGSSAIFEIAAWGLPSILIPLAGSAQDHQRGNAYSYARASATAVIEENNLTPHVLLSEIQRLLSDKKKLEIMSINAKKFSQPEAARKIAQEIIDLALEHA